MGRVLEALKQGQAPRPAPEERPAAAPAGPEPQPLDGRDEGPIPFIEVGPRKSVEGSPDVLAFLPARREEDPGTGSSTPPRDGAARSGGVGFRPVVVPAESWGGRSRLAPELVAYH